MATLTPLPASGSAQQGPRERRPAAGSDTPGPAEGPGRWTGADRWALALTVVLAAALRLWRVTGTGYGNPYYSATVRSMTTSWHNFFFASFDPAGYMSIDKPPLAFWLQTAAVHVLGFGPLALVLPSAIAGICAVGILFVTVRRVFGTAPATVAALVLALTPISVATDRFNDPDALLALLLVLAAWFVVRAAETGSWRCLLLAGAVIGLAVP